MITDFLLQIDLLGVYVEFESNKSEYVVACFFFLLVVKHICLGS